MVLCEQDRALGGQIDAERLEQRSDPLSGQDPGEEAQDRSAETDDEKSLPTSVALTLNAVGVTGDPSAAKTWASTTKPEPRA